MSKIVSDNDIVKLFIPQKASQDSLLATAAVTMIAGTIAVIGIAPSINQLIRILLSVSIGSLTISLFLLLWYNPRLEKRSKLMKQIVEQRIVKIKEDIRKFTKMYYTPLFKAKLINNLEKLKSKKFSSKKEYDEAVKLSIDQADKETAPTTENKNFALEFFYKDFMTDMYFMDEKIFHTPIDESHSKIKHFLDIFSFKFRYHFFVFGTVTLTFSIIFHLLLG